MLLPIHKIFTTWRLTDATPCSIISCVRGDGVKSYSVKEIADLLDTNPETVRRWIRSGKLNAADDSKKKGENKVILESALNSFLKASPQYAAKIAGSLSLGSGVIAASILGTAHVLLAAKDVETKRLSKARVSEDSFYAFLAGKIAEERAKLEKLVSEREELNQKIQMETEVLNQLLEKLKDLDGATANQ